MNEKDLPKLGRIEKIDIKNAWKKENEHFTPWLEREIDILNDTLGTQIETLEKESKVGDFRADLFGKDLNKNTKVIIENQYGKTDHDHLGKLLTYGAGKDAGIIIWIAEEFREKHRSVLDWLNESSGENRLFFGIEIEVVKIGESELAPNFKVVSEPNEWERSVGPDEGEEVTEKEKKYKEFWRDMFGSLRAEIPSFTSSRTPQPQCWMSVGAGKTGVHYRLAFRWPEDFEVGLYLEGEDANKNKEHFDQLKEYKDEVEDIISEEVVWDEKEDAKRCEISVYKEGASIEDAEEDLEEVKEWAIERVDEFKKAFDDKIRNLG